ncbi:MAG: hypothetical protein ACJAWL_002517 [Motiliproteus sp.]|jgi:hypothetical protein
MTDPTAVAPNSYYELERLGSNPEQDMTKVPSHD